MLYVQCLYAYEYVLGEAFVAITGLNKLYSRSLCPSCTALHVSLQSVGEK